jgi:formylglycine-generating enzyme required for sulfatase activity
MGSPRTEDDRAVDEGPQHEVRITRELLVGIYPVTQEEYKEVMGSNPSHFSASGVGSSGVKEMSTSKFPVEQVSWHDAVKFCERLSALKDEKAARRTYRLPTEAEWEYACRAGTTTPFNCGDSLSTKQANFAGRYYLSGGVVKGHDLKRMCKVGSYQPNKWGLYDMHGNVRQWCADWYRRDYYKQSDKDDPSGPKNGSGRVCRGGSWWSSARDCRSARRDNSSPEGRDNYTGFRVVCTVAGAP